ncbi:hypothetical protein Apa02nite_035770 [Actinoplanes palleronii]|uniref:Lipoprotein n=2 Tax=Actinoplanes palleronii TaxID=113570 RepID=A0ABQ4BA12_9ACTN|nr:hypothetical protein Apa02nite_035770 [Actinoplanes palleronii]
MALLAMLPAGCTPSATVSAPTPAPAMSSVPAGCDLTRAGVQWSGVTQESVLEHASLFTTDAMREGTEVLDAPVTAAVAGVTVPDGWLRLLATDLGNKIGVGVHTTRPSRSYKMNFGTWGLNDPEITEIIVYAGVRRISAVFPVGCAPAVSGTLTAWTETKTGGLTCGDPAPPTDPYTRAAREYCPHTSPSR